jgi:hypothetical protein
MWEISGSPRLPGATQHFADHQLFAPRLIEGGVSVCIAPAGGGAALPCDAHPENS